jgi:hypothetical protein
MMHNRKAIISEDGLSIGFMYNGHEWTASPSEVRPGFWFVKHREGSTHGFGLDIWAAIEDAKGFNCQLRVSEVGK